MYCLSIFQRTCASFSKAGAKIRGFILTAKLFGSFFRFSFSVRFSGSLSERERRDENDKRKTASLCESDCKYKNFIYYNPNFFGSFFVLFFKWDSTFSLSQFVKAFFSWKAGAKVRPFDIYSKYIKLFFLIIFEYIC